MYSQELIDKVKEFWYIFDERYTYFPADVANLYLNCNLLKHNPNSDDPRSYTYNFDWIFFALQNKMRLDPHNYEDLFLKELDSFKDGIKSLANDQMDIISKNLDFNEIQKALELFGQGVIYDDRRKKVHKMDGRFPHDLVGYRRWHGFSRAAALTQKNDFDFWLNLDKSIFLAFLIQSELKPLDTKKDNPFMNEERLNAYIASCNSLKFKDLDNAFNYNFP